MMQALLVIITLLGAFCAVLLFIASSLKKRVKKAESKAAYYQEALEEVRTRSTHLSNALAKDRELQEEANAEQKELADTPDSLLRGRANRLFGVPDDEAKRI